MSGIIELPYEPTDDTEITCIFCRAPRPCEFGIHVKRDGEQALVGLHAACVKPLRMKNEPDDFWRKQCQVWEQIGYQRGRTEAIAELGREASSIAEERADAAKSERERCVRELLNLAELVHDGLAWEEAQSPTAIVRRCARYVRSGEGSI